MCQKYIDYTLYTENINSRYIQIVTIHFTCFVYRYIIVIQVLANVYKLRYIILISYSYVCLRRQS